MDMIKQEILRNQQRLSRVNVDFLEFIKKNPEGLRRSSYADVVKFNFGPSNLQPWPTFISPQVKKQLQEASTAVFQLVKQIPACIFDNNPQKISAYFGFPLKSIQLQLEDVKNGHLDNLLARGDFVFSSAGLKCIEYNITSSLGGWQLPILESTYLNSPVIAKFIQEYQVKIRNKNQYEILLQHLLTTVKKKFTGDNLDEINIGFAIHEYRRSANSDIIEEEFNRQYQLLLKEQGSHCQGGLFFFDFPHLTIDNNCIFYKGKRIHALVEMYHGNIPVQAIYVSLMGNLIIFNGPITNLLSNKLNLALLSENEDTGAFTPGDREIIKKYIPWTRRIVPGEVTFRTGTFDLVDFLSSHREKLVIKPDRELGGKDVHVGKFTGAEQWEEAIGNALRDKDRNWLVQEYVEPSTHFYQYGDDGYAEHQIIWGLFVFGSAYAGGFMRLIPQNGNHKGVINTHQGSEKTAIFEVTE